MSKPKIKALDACKEYLRRYDAMKLNGTDGSIPHMMREAVEWHEKSTDTPDSPDIYELLYGIHMAFFHDHLAMGRITQIQASKDGNLLITVESSRSETAMLYKYEPTTKELKALTTL